MLVIENTAVGCSAGGALEDGQHNVCIGAYCGESGSSFNDSVFVGYSAGAFTPVTGNGNTIIGNNAVPSLSSGSNNIAIGNGVDLLDGTADNQVVIGAYRLPAPSVVGGILVNTAGDGIYEEVAFDLTAGYIAGINELGASAMPSGTALIIGNDTAPNLLSGPTGGNTILGVSSATNLTSTGTANVIVGDQAGRSLVDGTTNIVIGSGTGFGLVSGSGTIMMNSSVSGDPQDCVLMNTATLNDTDHYTNINNTVEVDLTNNIVSIGTDVTVFRPSVGGWIVGSGIGSKQLLRGGTNAAAGTDTLVAGEVVISTTAIGSGTVVVLTSQDDNGGTAGAIRVSSRNPGTDFTITSTSALDTSIVYWELKEII